ncbi:hypothetical protein Sliba_15760 [Streptomyces nigrescens]|uniref:AB hydrolase-1 domain-containing protein n=1 Tax=Streptomyces nigrescens TaxID=1920 RepID=A0A640TBJ2_STRNI|nr:hypothetical protein Sliba_15760 [Streptomyces libani subsp. libani]GGV89005.1 hypothetical protein GCM10010500_13170 [Streptomyces libani subsp. libani]
MSQNFQTPLACQRTALSADGTPISYRTMGDGPHLILLGGALRTSDDYLPLASVLATSFRVHLVERRGRGASGPQGPHYTLRKEVEDLLAVQSETGRGWPSATAMAGLSSLRPRGHTRCSTALRSMSLECPQLLFPPAGWAHTGND